MLSMFNDYVTRPSLQAANDYVLNPALNLTINKGGEFGLKKVGTYVSSKLTTFLGYQYTADNVKENFGSKFSFERLQNKAEAIVAEMGTKTLINSINYLVPCPVIKLASNVISNAVGTLVGYAGDSEEGLDKALLMAPIAHGLAKVAQECVDNVAPQIAPYGGFFAYGLCNKATQVGVESVYNLYNRAKP